MKSINKNAAGPLKPQHQRAMKLSKGCHNRQPFSFANISRAISYNKDLLQYPCAHPTRNPSCFTSQTEILVYAPIKHIKPLHKTSSYQPIENGGIILYCLLVAFLIGVKNRLHPDHRAIVTCHYLVPLLALGLPAD